MKNTPGPFGAVAVAVLAALLGGAPATATFPGGNGRIAFQSNRVGDFQIFVMNADGSAQTKLTTQGANAYPGWSPDGSRIAFVSTRTGTSQIFVMNADGTGQNQVTNDGMTKASPAWSPDGTKIAFSGFGGSNYDIWVTTLDGTSLANVTNNAAEDVSPSWQPGTSRIAFQTNRDGNGEIYAVNADGSGLMNLTNDPQGNDGDPDWSPDGQRIVYARGTVPPAVDIYVMNADGSGKRPVIQGNSDLDPTWSPDGTKLAFRSARDLNDEVYVANADGTNPVRLTNNAPPGNTIPEDWFPSWQPLPLPTTTSSTTTSSTSTTTAATTTSTSTTSTTIGARCTQIAAARDAFNLNITATEAAIRRSVPLAHQGQVIAQLEAARSRTNSQFDRILETCARRR